ncbi:MAG: acetate--CoA ligase family protein [Bradymonadales bacterium]|nr:acetate--CoA ligase family protein [Bradymonadales bacterium]
MSQRNLDALFRPQSVAVVGASRKPMSVGQLTMVKLLEGGFAGPIMPVHPQYASVAGVLAYPDVQSLPVVPDLAVICTPPATVPGLIHQLGERGTRAAIVITAGLGSMTDERGRTLKQAMLDAARPYTMRILGNNTVGLLVPGIGLNATFAHTSASPGSIAFVAQSGGMFTSVLDYAVSNSIGFSHFISLGDTADVDYGDCLDYLAADPSTGAILMYVEFITAPRKFMSAARAAARRKPVLVVKSGRVPEGAKAAASHTGALAGSDDVYEAAFRRAGILRVHRIEDLFDAVETLAWAKPIRGDRLAILTNGGGPGVVAADSIVLEGGKLATLSPATMDQLDEMLPRTWSRGNPVDIIGDTPGEYYGKVLDLLLQDDGVDAALVMHAPVSLISPTSAAGSVIEVASRTAKTVLTSWIGDRHQEEARRLFRQARIPSYWTPEQAGRAYMHLVSYQRRQEILMETPPSIPFEFTPDRVAVREIIDHTIEEGRTLLTEPESKAVLAAYGIPVVQTRIAKDKSEALQIAQDLGFPVAVKILSEDITHKSDVGGVVLDLETPGELEQAIGAMLARVQRMVPDARIIGFTVQQMARRPLAHELIVGVTTDPIFGPVILFGQGGTAVEVVQDRALGLPPLNLNLARDLLEQTRIAKLLRGYRDRPAADLEAICLTVDQVSQLLVDFAEIEELDINPLFADDRGVLALDARIVVCGRDRPVTSRLSISPYPRELEESAVTANGEVVLLRPLRPEDEQAHQEFFHSLTPQDIRFRFFGHVKSLPHREMAKLTQIDYDREMAFIATTPADKGEGTRTMGVMRAILSSGAEQAEFAIVVRPEAKGQRLEHLLLDKMIRYLRSRGTRELTGLIHVEDEEKLKLIQEFQFDRDLLPESHVVAVRKLL